MVLGSGYSLETSIHGWKWWHAIFWGLLDLVFANAYIIWKYLYGKKDTSRFKFMVRLQEQLVDNHFVGLHTPRSFLYSNDCTGGHILVRMSLRESKYCVVCADDRKRYMREGKEVVGPKPSRTVYGCSMCKNFLCIEPCFYKYHAMTGYDHIGTSAKRVVRSYNQPTAI